MKEKLQQIKEDALKQIQESEGLTKLNDVRVSVLGKKGELTQLMKSMKNLSAEERPAFGQMVNETREAIEFVEGYYTQIGYSAGVYGCNGMLLQGHKTGKLYAITARTSAIFVF